MQIMSSRAEQKAGRTSSEAMVESLATTQVRGETLTELAHDARNMVTALALYCELLDEPGVLNPPYRHYGSELRMVAEGSRRLLERMLVLDANQAAIPVSKPAANSTEKRAAVTLQGARPGEARYENLARVSPDEPVTDFREEVLANRNVLSTLAGPNVAVSISACGGAVAVPISGEELTRVLVNLVRNGAEAISGVGAIRISLGERRVRNGQVASVTLSVDDSGCGIPEEHIEKIFESGFTTRNDGSGVKGWTSRNRGLGLSITRSIVEAAGGRIQAENRPQGGARFQIELPVRTR